MSRARTGPTRAEIVSTAVVAVLVALGLVALWPRSSAPGEPASAAAPVEAGAVVSDADLAPLRTAAALAPCPGPAGQVAAAGPLVGVTVPCLGAPGVVDVGQAFAGRAALLNVWASWCVPCRDELPALAEYAARPEAVPVLGVDVRDDPRAALTLLRELEVTIPSVTDPDGALRGALAVPPALPVTYVVRMDGTVVRVDPPTPFRSADEVAAAVERLR